MARTKQIEIEDFEENIIEKPIENVLPDSMMPYSEYIIMDRALPRVEDGLKPVQRRILYTMFELNLRPDAGYKKSARIVGDCLGKYHPHGDSSVYDAMVRMAQDFSMRSTLVDGHGNFGSIEGDPPAAMRYTEVRLDKLALELLRDIDKKTVGFNRNFDDTLDEPDILPGRFPNLLVNGAEGIAIGLATKIPPHNLTEVIDGTVAYIDNPKITTLELMNYIKGPDFPSGGFLIGKEGLQQAYETGKGQIEIRAKMDIENADGDKQNIVITEIPFQVNPSILQERIYELKEKKKELYGNIIDIANESDRSGMRIVIKVKKGEDVVKMAKNLLIHSSLSIKYHFNVVAIASGRPQQLGLYQIIKYYVEYQRNIILRRSEFDLSNFKKREHILDGYLIAIPNIDEVIRIIRNSSSRSDAKSTLRDIFSLSDAQAEAILELQLGNINRLDVTKFEKELQEIRPKIARLSSIIASKTEQLKVVREELIDIRDRFRTKRMTTIINNPDDIEIKAYDPTKRSSKRGVIALSYDDKIKFVNSRSYCYANKEISENTINGIAKELVSQEVDTDTLIFGSLGNAYLLNTDTIIESKWDGEGQSLNELFKEATAKEKAVKLISFDSTKITDEEVIFFTKCGLVKKSKMSEYLINRDSFVATLLKEDDEVINVEMLKENSNILFVTSDGLVINTTTEEYPTQGRKSSGVIGASLNDNCYVVLATQITKDVSLDIAIVSDSGLSKRISIEEFAESKRNRKGVKGIELEDKKVLFAEIVENDFDLAIIDKNGEIIATSTENIRSDGNRMSKGKPLARGKTIVSVYKHRKEIS